MLFSPYPNIYQLLEVLKNVQSDIYIKMWNSNLTNKQIEDVEKDFVKNTMTQFETKNISRQEFVQKLAYTNLSV
jgi:hypothetical protein